MSEDFFFFFFFFFLGLTPLNFPNLSQLSEFSGQTFWILIKFPNFFRIFRMSFPNFWLLSEFSSTFRILIKFPNFFRIFRMSFLNFWLLSEFSSTFRILVYFPNFGRKWTRNRVPRFPLFSNYAHQSPPRHLPDTLQTPRNVAVLTNPRQLGEKENGNTDESNCMVINCLHIISSQAVSSVTRTTPQTPPRHIPDTLQTPQIRHIFYQSKATRRQETS